MQDPAAFAALHPVPGSVACIETHVSWVFLTGPFAYKVKKPLRLSFIDYSTAERRAALCREELRLNRRHAPGLYVDVVPIAGTPAAPRVGATDSPPFEHALRMVQFDPQLELTHLLQSGAVAAGELQDFGKRIAQMHATAAIAAGADTFGTPDNAHRITLDNFDEIARVLPGRDEAQQLALLRGQAQRLFAAGRPLMEQRRQDGRVREGHGDLHCGNVVRWQGTLAAFDGLEFDPGLRFIDVANDLAFLTMDLAAHGRTDLRREALQAWLETSGDFAAVALLPYFELYRALVRAKVAALRGQQARGTQRSRGDRSRDACPPVPRLGRVADRAAAPPTGRDGGIVRLRQDLARPAHRRTLRGVDRALGHRAQATRGLAAPGHVGLCARRRHLFARVQCAYLRTVARLRRGLPAGPRERHRGRRQPAA